MDPNGKSDPYCIINLGDQQQSTNVQYSTLNPEWRETFKFELSAIPQLIETGRNTCMMMMMIRIVIMEIVVCGNGGGDNDEDDI